MIVTGMGFIGYDAIFKGNDSVKGIATASSLWNLAAIGVSVAYACYEFAIILSVVNCLILQFSEPLRVKEKRE